MWTRILLSSLILIFKGTSGVSSTAIRIPRNDTVPSSDGTFSKDFRIQCDSSSLGLVQSRSRPYIYYLRAICGGLYNDPHASRCSFLDLNMCYINDAGNIKAQQMGGFLNSCGGCTLYAAHSDNMLGCTCGRGEASGGGAQEAAVHLDDLLFVKNGFLSCYGFTNFECPGDNDPY
ncbi:hypothetical protein AAE478_005165 [Parahypoxylon ruwenzoriense]